MENKIGIKIKAARKELKLTQTALAGKEMTKSMLSQIENGYATPSMKNLTYLAHTLGKPIAYFLEDNTSKIKSATSLPIAEINKTILEIQELCVEDKPMLAKNKIENLLNTYNFDRESKLYADILSEYGDTLNSLGEFSKSETIINQCVDIYLQLTLYIDAAKVYQTKALKAFANSEYENSIKILTKAYSIYSKSINTDTIFELDNIYYKANALFSLGRTEETIALFDKALDISNKVGTYYKTDEFYRMKALCYFCLENYEGFKVNIEKAKQFAELTENKWVLVSIELNLASYENEMENPKAAIAHMEKYHKLSKGETYSNWYMHEVSQSLYKLERYEEAYSLIIQYDYSTNRYSKIDYLKTWSTKIYEGLILHKLRKTNDGISAIKLAIEKLSIHSNSKFLAFAYKSLGELYADLENYKEAYTCEKMSIQIKDALIKKGQTKMY